MMAGPLRTWLRSLAGGGAVGPGRSPRAVFVVSTAMEARALASAIDPGAVVHDAAWVEQRLDDDCGLAVCGVGKVNAAACTALLIRGAPPGAIGCVLSVGIAGALPVADAPGIGQSVAATASVFADEGVRTPEGFLTCEQLGFPLWGPEPADPRWIGRCASLREVLGGACTRRGIIATVSACSGTDRSAAEIAERTGAVAEGMEGAGVVLVAQRLGVHGGEVRAISNTTGDRTRQRWDVRAGLEELRAVMARLMA
jgi:futalosine hydrolase